MTDEAAKKGDSLEKLIRKRAEEIQMINDIGKEYGIEMWDFIKKPGAAAMAGPPKPPTDSNNKPDPNEQTDTTGETGKAKAGGSK
jgi:hypothetical protein